MKTKDLDSILMEVVPSSGNDFRLYKEIEGSYCLGFGRKDFKGLEKSKGNKKLLFDWIVHHGGSILLTGNIKPETLNCLLDKEHDWLYYRIDKDGCIEYTSEKPDGNVLWLSKICNRCRQTKSPAFKHD